MKPAPADTNTDPEQIDGPAAPPVDPEAEWSQRMLQGMNRMDRDPEFRESIERRIS